MAILSIQSQVANGHVGNSAAVFALQRQGREVWAVPTTLLSHHPGHGGADGGPVAGELQMKLLEGLRNRGCFGRCEAVVSGYLGHAGSAAAVARALDYARAAAPGAVYLCDPVLGDDGRLYVREEIVAAMHDLAIKADILTPNAFELALLSGQDCGSRAAALAAMRVLQARGPGIVLLSSFAGEDTPDGVLDVMALDGEKAWRVSVPRFGQHFPGAGDLFAAMFLHHWLESRDVGAALGPACASVAGVLAATASVKADEMLLIPAQGLLTAPENGFLAERLA